MAKHDKDPGGQNGNYCNLYGAVYEGAEVDWQHLRYAAMMLHQNIGDYTIADYKLTDEPLKSTFLGVSSRNNQLNAIAEIVFERDEECQYRIRDFFDNMATLPEESFAEFGIKRLSMGAGYILFEGKSTVQTCVYLADSAQEPKVYISNTLDLILNPPDLAETNCLDALEEFTSLWLIALREAEKTIDYKKYGLSDLRLVVSPKKRSSKELIPAETAQQETEEELEQPKILLHDVGGNAIAKNQLLDLAESFKKSDTFKKWGVSRPSGILLHGPPGTGKTMLITAFANEIGAELIAVQSTDFRDMWYGNAEKNLKQIFSNALEATELTVLFFDELDGIIQHSTHGSEVRQSEAAIFKQELSRLAQTNPNVILMAATNDLASINEALVRAGRFDKKIAVTLPTEQDRAQIFGIKIMKVIEALQTEKFAPFDLEDIDVTELARATDEKSGADIEAIIVDLLYQKALYESRTGKDSPITQRDILGLINDHRKNQA